MQQKCTLLRQGIQNFQLLCNEVHSDTAVTVSWSTVPCCRRFQPS